MMFAAKIFCLASLAVLTFANPISRPDSVVDLLKRQAATTCGSTYYTSAKVASAKNAACNYVQSGTKAGGSTYPHKYNNYEGFNFPVPGPYQEFPLKSSGVYTGGIGSPGADRVIINTSCQYAGAITHTGASGNAFVGCSGTS